MSIPVMIIFLAAVGAVVMFVIVTCNRLVSLTQRAQSSHAEIEESIRSGRRYFNAVVRDLNTAIQEFPSNLVAAFFQFRPRSYFELDRSEGRHVPTVSFGA